MATSIVTGGSQHVDRPFDWHVWKLELTSVVDDEDPVITLDTLPSGVIVLSGYTQILVADTAGTSSTVALHVGTQPVVAAANAKTLTLATLATIAACGDASVDGLAGAQAVTAVFARTGAATTLPTVICALLCGRVEY